MSENSNIEWTETTWNPIAGCSIVSPGCHKCYAMRMAARLQAMGKRKYAGTTTGLGTKARWTGKINLERSSILAPLNWRKPRRIFVNSMSDLFHEEVPDEWIDQVVATMWTAEWHTFHTLTKRADRQLRYLNSTHTAERVAEIVHRRLWTEDPAKAMMVSVSDIASDVFLGLENWWVGVSVEDQSRADERIPYLIQTASPVLWVSAEPLLSEIDFARWMGSELDWIVVGGETGVGARKCSLDWIRKVIRQCGDAHVPVFVKQLGARPVGNWGDDPPTYCLTTNRGTSRELSQHKNGVWKLHSKKGGMITEFPADMQVREYPRQVQA